MKDKRIAYFDNCKFFLIALVVIGHCVQDWVDFSHLYRSIFLFIYSFHMPLFIFIAGLFYDKKETIDKKLNRSIFFFILYVILKIISVIITLICKESVEFSLLSEAGLPWFCLVLAIFPLIVHLLKKANINPIVYLLFSILLACFVGFDKSIVDFLCISRVIIFFPFYLLGTIIPKNKINTLAKNKILKIISLLVFIALFILCYIYIDNVYILRHLFTGRNPFMNTIATYGPLLRLLCYTISIIIGFSFLMIIPTKKLGKITVFGQRSIQVYFWHVTVLWIFIRFHAYKYISIMGYWGKIIWIVVGLCLTVLLSLKIFSFPTSNIKKILQDTQKDVKDDE